MVENVKWPFFDVGSTLIDEHMAYEPRMREIAEAAGTTFEKVYELAMNFYAKNKKGDLEVAKLLGVKLTKWHKEEDTTIYKRDSESIRCYKMLCDKELEWCKSNSETICNKANVLYKKYISNEIFSGRNRCLNFPKLETICEKYNKK